MWLSGQSAKVEPLPIFLFIGNFKMILVWKLYELSYSSSSA